MFAGLLRRASVTSAHTRLRAMAQASSTSPAGGIRTDKLDLGAASGREGVVLLACGSFNPPHKVHVRMLELAGDALSRTGVQVLGAYMSPVSSRYEKKGLVDAKHRVAMCEAAVRDSALVMVDDWEATQPQWSRTVDVLESVRSRIRESVGGAPVRVMIVCGSDLIESFTVPNLWSEEHMLSLVVENGIVCISRPGYDGRRTLEGIDSLHDRQGDWRTLFVENDVLADLSSTKLREALASGDPIEDLVPEGVEAYVRENGLYAGGA